MKLCFHIGAGKTGTSSIQRALRENVQALRAQGVWYLGLMFELAPEQLFPWQKTSGESVFSKLPQDEAERQLSRLLARTLELAGQAGAHTLIWSNEAFFDRHVRTFAPLQALVEQGTDVQVLAYVRRHEDWAQSAYIQWGIHHKTFPGPIRPFDAFVQARPAVLADTLHSFETELPGRLLVRNYDAAGDAVDDFCRALGLGRLPCAVERRNVTAGNEEVLMRALFNDGLPDVVLPMLFDRVVGRHTDFGDTPTGYLARLLPDAADIEAVDRLCTADRQQVNLLLEAQGQPPLRGGAGRVRSPEVDESQLLMAVLRLVVLQARRIETLDNRLKALTEQQVHPA